MRCRQGSGMVNLNVHVPKQGLASVADVIRRNRSLEIRLGASDETMLEYPGLGFDMHDETWQFQFRLALDSPFFAALARSGRIEIGNAGFKKTYRAAGIVKAFPRFHAACRESPAT
jgi:hypothetical protein